MSPCVTSLAEDSEIGILLMAKPLIGAMMNRQTTAYSAAFALASPARDDTASDATPCFGAEVRLVVHSASLEHESDTVIGVDIR